MTMMMTKSRFCLYLLLILTIAPGCGDFKGKQFAANLSGLSDENEEGCFFFAPDILALPGQSITLQANVSNVIGDKRLDGIHVEFSRVSDGSVIGQAVTNTEGLAEIMWTPPCIGDYDMEIKFTKVPEHLDEDIFEISPTFLLACVRPAEESFLVIDLDRTLVNDNFLKVLTHHAKPLPNSQAAMTKLAKQYSVIYLTQRPVGMMTLSKKWLKKYKFPSGPLLMAQPKDLEKNSAWYKSSMIKDIRKTHPNLKIGIGDKGNDTAAYRENGMEAWWIVPYKKDVKDLRKIANRVRSHSDPQVKFSSGWADIEKGNFYTGIQYAHFLEKLADDLGKKD